MNTLELYNEAERRITWALTLEQLETAGQWLKSQFQENPEAKEVIREDLTAIYKRRLYVLGKTEPTPTTKTRTATLHIKQWLARDRGILREMEVEILKETAKAYLVKGQAATTPTSTCRHCGRALTHPVSVLYGIGPECGKHYHIPKNLSDVEEIRKLVQQVKFEGWLPKAGITDIVETAQ